TAAASTSPSAAPVVDTTDVIVSSRDAPGARSSAKPANVARPAAKNAVATTGADASPACSASDANAASSCAAVAPAALDDRFVRTSRVSVCGAVVYALRATRCVSSTAAPGSTMPGAIERYVNAMRSWEL